MKILIYVGDRSTDMPGVRLGSMLARSLGAELTLLHVAPKQRKKKEEREEGERLLAEVANTLKDIPVSTRVRRGSIADRILVEVQENQQDMVVICSARIGGHPRHISVNREILPKMPCCVLVVKNPREKINRILMLTGGIQISESMVKIGAKIASALKAQVTLMHVAANVPSMYTGLETIEETLEELLKTNTPVSHHLHRCAEVLSEFGVPSTLMLKHGEPVYEIIRETDRQDYDLVILGASGVTTGFREWLMGNVTRDVIDLVGIPVMVVNQSHARKLDEMED